MSSQHEQSLLECMSDMKDAGPSEAVCVHELQSLEFLVACPAHLLQQVCFGWNESLDVCKSA
jgi:hypothetical protein